GFTASAVCSVTDTPPTLLVCLNRKASVYPTFKENKVLSVNTLAQHHTALSNLFGGKTPMPERFKQGEWHTLLTGSPILRDAVVSFDCHVSHVAVGVTDMKESWFVKWRPYRGNIENTPVAMNEYLPAGQSIALGVQHAFAMFGATVLAPLLMGFDPSLTMFITGIGTILFFLITGGHVPSYLGSSFAFIGAVAAATGYSGVGSNPNIALALGGTIVCGIIYAIVGLIVMRTGTQWIERLMPPIVTGAIVMIIGLNLAPVTIKSVSGSDFDTWMALVTVLCIGSIAVFTRGMVRRLLLLVGLVLAYVIYFILANVMGLGKPIAFDQIANAAWFGLPTFH
ncbi:hypothetical protein GWI33_010015, partial [Rhynchophorus ferrugineus]